MIQIFFCSRTVFLFSQKDFFSFSFPFRHYLRICGVRNAFRIHILSLYHITPLDRRRSWLSTAPLFIHYSLIFFFIYLIPCPVHERYFFLIIISMLLRISIPHFLSFFTRFRCLIKGRGCLLGPSYLLFSHLSSELKQETIVGLTLKFLKINSPQARR